MERIIPVTKPFLPPIEDYKNYLEQIWERNWLTNNGPLVQQLEKELKKELNCNNLLYLSNGTIALQIAIKALDLKGEIITTPFSYVATTSSIVWEGCKPIFADIDANTLNIDPAKIKEVITENTSAILATHVYGNPCDTEGIKAIADKHNLKVIYDAAHAFGISYKGRSIFEHGDISTTSFHATKIFHTVEGGAVITKDATLSRRMERLRNFGHTGQENFNGIGVNGKNSEFHAAMGLCNLKYFSSIFQKRKLVNETYGKYLKSSKIRRPQLTDPDNYNYAYYPVIFESEIILLKVKTKLEEQNIFPRRYFFPELSVLDYVKSSSDLHNAKSISPRILCLPMYVGLEENDISLISKIILDNI